MRPPPAREPAERREAARSPAERREATRVPGAVRPPPACEPAERREAACSPAERRVPLIGLPIRLNKYKNNDYTSNF